MNHDLRALSCEICGQNVTLQIVHCGKCRAYLCPATFCGDVQDLVCKGEHVHDEDTCLICGCHDENACPSTDPYVINWSPTVRRRSESVT